MNKESYFWIISLIVFIIILSLGIYLEGIKNIEKERTKQICLNQGKSVLECRALSE